MGVLEHADYYHIFKTAQISSSLLAIEFCDFRIKLQFLHCPRSEDITACLQVWVQRVGQGEEGGVLCHGHHTPLRPGWGGGTRQAGR